VWRLVTAIGGPLPQGGALHNPETVLLIDDRDAELLEADAFLDQRVRADGDVDIAGGEGFQCLSPAAAGQGTGQQLDAQRPAGRKLHLAQQVRQRPVVLLRQDLRWRHNGALVAVGRRHDQGRARDRRLPAADIALEQPRHRPPGPDVPDDLADDALLGSGEGKGQG
jgi:hypothetical protein